MSISVKHILAVVAFTALLCRVDVANGQTFNPDAVVVPYTLSPAGNGVDGAPLVRVEVNVRKLDDATSTVAKAALLGVIFKGYEAAEGCTAQKPLFNKTELTASDAEYLTALFYTDNYSRYVLGMLSDQMIVTKCRRGYAVSGVVSVDKRTLRRDLERAGVLHRLGEGFQNSNTEKPKY